MRHSFNLFCLTLLLAHLWSSVSAQPDSQPQQEQIISMLRAHSFNVNPTRKCAKCGKQIEMSKMAAHLKTCPGKPTPAPAPQPPHENAKKFPFVAKM